MRGPKPILDYAPAPRRSRGWWFVGWALHFLICLWLLPGAVMCALVAMSFVMNLGDLTTWSERVRWLVPGLVILNVGVRLMDWYVKPSHAWNRLPQ